MTERREHEQRLRRERNLTDRVLETVPVGICVCTADGALRRVNDRFLHRFGGDWATLDGATLSEWELYDADDEPIAVAVRPWRRVAATGESVYDWQVQADLSEGGRRWLSINAAPIGAEGSEDDHVVMAVEDITELKRRERELSRQTATLETELGQIFGRITDGFYAIDRDWRVTHVNDRARELLDFAAEGLVGERIWDVFEWVSDTRLREEYERAMETQESTSFEFYYPDPLQAWFEINVYPSETGLSVYFRDVTERKRRERELEESERRYRTLVENFPNGAVALVDRDLRYQTVGGRPAYVVDRSVAEMEGSRVRAVLPSAIADELGDQYEAALNGEQGDIEAEFRGRTFQFWAVPVRDDDGDVFAAMGMSQEITERREYERKLEASNERLEQFAYAASHDLQEPLRMITSYLQLLERRYGDDLDADAEEFIEFAVDGAERMRAMIDGLLEYSRVETSGDSFEVVDLATVLDAVRDDLQIEIAESDAELDVDPLPRVEGDPDQLRQVFQNLLQNAIEYSGDAPPRIGVAAERDGGMWQVSVTDRGIGFDPDDADRIFEVFQRLHGHEDHPGTGIGLAICRRIVERHGGDIWVDADPGEGSTFSFTLPAADE